MENDVIRTRLRVLLGGVLVLWLSSCFFTVQEEEAAVRLFFGRPVGVETAAGLKLKWPLPLNTVARVDKRLLVYDSIASEYLTRDKKNIIAQCYAVWRVTDAEQMLKRTGDRASAEQKLDGHLNSAMGAAFGQYEFDQLVNANADLVKIEEVLDQVLQAVNQVVQQRQYGIEVEAVRLTRLSYPEDNLEEVFKRMRAERKTIAEKYRAEGTREATRIKSEADLQKERILAEARQKADVVRGSAEQEAGAVFAQSYRLNPSFWRYWRKLQAMDKVIDANTTIYLTPDVEIFSPFTSPAPQ